MSKIIQAIFAVALLVPALAFAELPVRSANGVLVNGKGMTLYTFDKDVGGNSVCNGNCAINWPPLVAVGENATGSYTIVTRGDSSKQWAYKGKPLYLFAKDQKSGDKTGDGVGGTWHVATP
jgi:predicted lipoprotein with Yx(FWY)xxD motif